MFSLSFLKFFPIYSRLLSFPSFFLCLLYFSILFPSFCLEEMGFIHGLDLQLGGCMVYKWRTHEALNRYCSNCPIKIRNDDLCNYDLLEWSRPKKPFSIKNFLSMLHFTLQKLSIIFKFVLSFSLLGNFSWPNYWFWHQTQIRDNATGFFHSLCDFERKSAPGQIPFW